MIGLCITVCSAIAWLSLRAANEGHVSEELVACSAGKLKPAHGSPASLPSQTIDTCHTAHISCGLLGAERPETPVLTLGWSLGPKLHKVP